MDRDRDRALGRDREREQELVPGAAEDDQPGRGDRRRDQRQGDAPERAPVVGAVDQRGLLELDRQVEEGLAQDHHDERHDERGVHEDQREMGVEQAEEAHHEVERDHDHDRRQHALGEEEDRDVAVGDQLEAEAGERVGRGRADQQRQQRREARDQARVGERGLGLGHGELIGPVVERRGEVDPRDAEARDREGLERRAQAGRQAPVEREQEDQRDRDREQRVERVAQLAVDRGRGQAGDARAQADRGCHLPQPLTAPSVRPRTM